MSSSPLCVDASLVVRLAADPGADWLRAAFWTADGRLARAVQDELPWVHLVDVSS